MGGVGTSVAASRSRHFAAEAEGAWHRLARDGARLRAGAYRRLAPCGAEGGDALLYAAACGFALLTGLFAGLPGYRVWAWLAIGPYGAAAVVSGVVGRKRSRAHRVSPGRAATAGRDGAVRGADFGPARVWVLLIVLLGATLVPLSVEVALRNDGPATSHVQPEVVVIAQAGDRLAQLKDPYQTTVRPGERVQSPHPGEPTFEAFFPYLPLMATFGLPKVGHGPVRVTDTRVLFSIVTLIVVGAALLLLRAPKDAKLRALQFLTVLPTAALPLATGGDDMPIVAFLLLAMVLAQRRRPGWSGIMLGIVASMKFTAWPLAVLALFAARDKDGRRAPLKMASGMLVVAGPVVVPFALSNLRAFVDNVILFPLGLLKVASPAASNLPGHVLVTELPALHVIAPVLMGAVGGTALVLRLVRRPPRTASDVLRLAGWVMLIAILFAPATRVGYLLYPADFFLWAWMLGGSQATGGAPACAEESAAVREQAHDPKALVASL